MELGWGCFCAEGENGQIREDNVIHHLSFPGAALGFQVESGPGLPGRKCS